MDIHVMNLLHGTQMSDNNGTPWIAVFLVHNAEHGIISRPAHHRQMSHDYHNHHQSVSITLGSEGTVVSLVLKLLIQRQFTYTEDSSEHKLLKTIKGKLRLSEEISDQEPMHICERLWQTPTDQYGQSLHKKEILLFCTLLFPAQT
jgi:hypothetical protein